jgi:hypothetical protein
MSVIRVFILWAGGEIGKHAGLRTLFPLAGIVGSSPTLPTK